MNKLAHLVLNLLSQVFLTWFLRRPRTMDEKAPLDQYVKRSDG